MSKDQPVTSDQARRVNDCMCFHTQRAARAMARHFDKALRPTGLTNGQFSLLAILKSAGEPRSMGHMAEVLAMDRTTLTAKLKPLERRGLVRVEVDPGDRRGRRLTLTAAGARTFASALPLWERAQAEAERLVPDADADRLRAALRAIS